MPPRIDRQTAAYRFHEIAARIKDWIGQEIVTIGERLPSERQLAGDLNVSRTSVREAFRLLEQEGLIEIRRGRKGGAYVIQPSFTLSPQELDKRLHWKQPWGINVTFAAFLGCTPP